MIEIKKIFVIKYGRRNFYFKNQKPGQTPYISSTSNNRGVMGYVDIKPEEAHIISVPRNGSVCHAFYQKSPCVLNDDCLILTPIMDLSEKEMIFYSLFIRQYKKLFDYSRKITPQRLEELTIPEKHEIPSWVYEIEIPDYSNVVEPKEDKVVELPSSDKWKEFSFDELFIIGKAKGPKAKEAEENIGDIPYITATSENNGIKCLTSIPARHKGNCLTIGHLGDPFYQEKDFSGNNVTYLYSKTNHMNQYIGLFLVSLMQFLPKKYNYGNVVGIAKMKNEKISLPVDSNGNPDWQLMEDYIKSLPYSKYL